MLPEEMQSTKILIICLPFCVSSFSYTCTHVFLSSTQPFWSLQRALCTFKFSPPSSFSAFVMRCTHSCWIFIGALNSSSPSPGCTGFPLHDLCSSAHLPSLHLGGSAHLPDLRLRGTGFPLHDLHIQLHFSQSVALEALAYHPSAPNPHHVLMCRLPVEGKCHMVMSSLPRP